MVAEILTAYKHNDPGYDEGWEAAGSRRTNGVQMKSLLTLLLMGEMALGQSMSVPKSEGGKHEPIDVPAIQKTKKECTHWEHNALVIPEHPVFPCDKYEDVPY